MDKLYISRKEAMYALMREANTHMNPVKRAYTRAAAIVEHIPVEDVQPVKHGRWIITDDVEHFIAVCSECGRTEDSRDIKDMPYCHCGARMDGGNK